MALTEKTCPDCSLEAGLDRRGFLQTVGVTAATAAGLPLFATPKVIAAPTPKSAAETAVKALYDSLTDDQKKDICFAWDHQDPKRGLLRNFVDNNWQITKHVVRGPFFTAKQQGIIHDVYKGLLSPEWVERFDRQTREDNGGKPWGTFQSIAVFGTPGTDKFELVMTGRHMTLRADGNSTDHAAFGGPIFYGHQGEQFFEKANHPGNVFWSQALAANKVYEMLDVNQREKALVRRAPPERGRKTVDLQGASARLAGIPVTALSADQKEELQKVLTTLVEPFRTEDREEALECLKKQGGLDGCHLSFFEDGDIGDDKVWDNWRLEGSAFIWYFRGSPHVHVWVHVADKASSV